MGLNASVSNEELVQAFFSLGLKLTPGLSRDQAYEAILARVIEQPEISDVPASTITTLYKLGFLIVDEQANLYQI